MKKLLCLCWILVCVNKTHAQSNELSDVIGQIEMALANANAEIGMKGGTLPKIKSADLTLETTVSSKGGAKFKLLVISFGKSISKERSQQITVSLVPKPNNKMTILPDSSFRKELQSLIVETSKGLQNSENGIYPLSVKQVTVELSFVLKSDGDAGLNFKIVPVTLELAGDLSKESVHKVRLTF